MHYCLWELWQTANPHLQGDSPGLIMDGHCFHCFVVEHPKYHNFHFNYWNSAVIVNSSYFICLYIMLIKLNNKCIINKLN